MYAGNDTWEEWFSAAQTLHPGKNDLRGGLKQEIEAGAVPQVKRTEFSGNGEDNRTVPALYEFEGKGVARSDWQKAPQMVQKWDLRRKGRGLQ